MLAMFKNNKNKLILITILFVCYGFISFAQNRKGFEIVRLKYDGGSDWYNDQSAEINLLKFISENTNVEVNPVYKFVDIGSDEIYSHPFLFLTGHGNIVFSDEQAERLRDYLERGGFLYIDDDYGLDKAVRREFMKVFPAQQFVELPVTFGLYHIFYQFNQGVPKTHQHDGKPPQGFGLFVGNRLAVFYTYESNPSDGWADPEVHHDPENKRIEALKFGTNIVLWALTN